MKETRKSIGPKRQDRFKDGVAYYQNAIREAKAEHDEYCDPFESFCTIMGNVHFLYKAAESFDLDLANQAQRDALLGVLATIVFSEPAKGRPRQQIGKWDRLTLIQLAVDCNNVKADTPGISDMKAAAEVKARYPGRYKHNSAEMIRQKLKLARMWLENENLERVDRGIAPITLELVRPVFTVRERHVITVE